MSDEMEFTGERFVPQVHGNIELEHLHRYLMACELAAGKDVLDIACGEGYGSARLSRCARQVYGVDISKETVTHAGKNYAADNIRFLVGSCEAIPLPDQSVDLVVSFETIEHHDKHEEMMIEIKRVLRPNGVVIISSPDKQVYSIEPNYKNPYHVKELFAEEFKELLSKHFKNTKNFGQKVTYGSAILEQDGSSPQKSYWDKNDQIHSRRGSYKPVYIVTIASDAELPVSYSGIYDRPEAQSEFASYLRSIIEERDRQIAEQDQKITSLTRNISSKHDQVRTLSEIIQSAKDWQKKSLFKRTFHKWRPRYDSVYKVHFFKKLERSIRKRRNKLLKRNASAMPKLARTEVELVSFAKEIQVFQSRNPKISVIIPVYGQIDYTLNCLKTIYEHPPKVEFEVIVINDCSPDSSKSILEHVEGIHLINNVQNLGFIRSSNAGANAAKGEYLYFLNNDTQVTSGWMDELLMTFEHFPGTGLAGSKLVYPHGPLQEAGGIIWQDGSAWNYGRNQDPKLPHYNYAREVDYCSGASIMVPKKLFYELGGFDEHYLPAYCEDSDLALKIRDKGMRVIYQPLSEIIHFEGISSGTDISSGVKSYQVENMKKIYDRWKHRLANHQPNAIDVDNAKDRTAIRRVLFLDQCNPTPDRDSGSIDSFNTMILLRDMGFQVTFIPVSNLSYDQKYTTAIQRMGIESLYRPYVCSVDQHLAEHGIRYELIFACRYNTLEPHYPSLRKYCPNAKIIFHTVDLHFLRMQREANTQQLQNLHDRAKVVEATELKLIDKCELTTVVSQVERDVLSRMNCGQKVRVMPYSRNIRGTRRGFNTRKHLVFVGGFQHHPNTGAVQYFVGEIMPLLRNKLPGIVFNIVGSMVPPAISELQCKDVVVHGFVEDLNSLLDEMRVSIAPLRYGAGIKGKIGSAMAVGLPVVGTSMAVEGMELSHCENILIADTPDQFSDAVAELYQNEDLWNRISSNGLVFAAQAWGPAAGWRILQEILQDLDMEVDDPCYKISLYS